MLDCAHCAVASQHCLVSFWWQAHIIISPDLGSLVNHCPGWWCYFRYWQFPFEIWEALSECETGAVRIYTGGIGVMQHSPADRINLPGPPSVQSPPSRPKLTATWAVVDGTGWMACTVGWKTVLPLCQDYFSPIVSLSFLHTLCRSK